MITNKESYIHLIEYLTEHLSLFETSSQSNDPKALTVIEKIEEELGDQIVNVCMQNNKLTSNQRNTIISEVDLILSDLEEVLSGVINNPITEAQQSFIEEFAILIKNIFDSEINK